MIGGRDWIRSRRCGPRCEATSKWTGASAGFLVGAAIGGALGASVGHEEGDTATRMVFGGAFIGCVGVIAERQPERVRPTRRDGTELVLRNPVVVQGVILGPIATMAANWD